MKKFAFDSALVICGLPILGGAFLAISSFHPASAAECEPRMKIASFILLFTSVCGFAVVWRLRARWLKQEGIFQTFKSFSAFLSEGHEFPSASEDEIREFRFWLDAHPLPEPDDEEGFDPYAAAKLLFTEVLAMPARTRLLLGLLGHTLSVRAKEDANNVLD